MGRGLTSAAGRAAGHRWPQRRGQDDAHQGRPGADQARRRADAHPRLSLIHI